MWIKMKTFFVQNEEDIDEILENNKKNIKNMFELNMKNVLWSNKKNTNRMDLTVLQTNITPLKIYPSYCSVYIKRMNSQMYIVSCSNIKNNKGEYFSSIIGNLYENDRIIIINGVVLKQFTRHNSNKPTVLVRPQDNSSVILFRYVDSSFIEKSNSILEKNLSLLIGSGLYSLYGNIKKITKCITKKSLLLRLQCCDKSCIKTYKFSLFFLEHKKRSKKNPITGSLYDFFSNKVSIHVKNPCKEFTSLSLNQRICLNNVKVLKSITMSSTKIFELSVIGNIQNLKVDPIDNGIVNPLRPPEKHLTVPSKLELKTGLEINPLVHSDVQMVSKARILEPSTTISPPETLTSCHQCEYNKKSWSFGEGIDNATDPDLLSFKKIKPNLNIKNQKCNDNLSLDSSNKDTNLYERKICSDREISPCCISVSSCSYDSFNSEPELLISNQETPSSKFNFNVVREPAQCIGPCRLIYTEPNIFNSSEIISGYCTECMLFVQKCYIIFSNGVYKCPKCSNIAHLTFYFKMIFLYGNNESQAIHACCYDKNAENVIRTISKKKIKLEQYLSNSDNRTLVLNSMKLLISNKTKINIIFSYSPENNTNVLESMDTKYIVTTTTTQ